MCAVERLDSLDVCLVPVPLKSVLLVRVPLVRPLLDPVPLVPVRARVPAAVTRQSLS
jgi:hypothetical protein